MNLHCLFGWDPGRDEPLHFLMINRTSLESRDEWPAAVRRLA